MKTRGVLGKRIARIVQRRFYNPQIGRMTVAVEALVLDDGTELHPIAEETEFEPIVDLVHVRPDLVG